MLLYLYSNVNVECDDYESFNDEVTVIYNVLVQRKYEGSDEIAESMRQVRLNFKDDNATAEIAVLTVQYPISDNILAYRLLHLTDI